MLKREDVEWAYRLFLCREPDEQWIAAHQNGSPDRQRLRDAFVKSEEFRWYLRQLGFVPAQVIGCTDVDGQTLYVDDSFFPLVSDFILKHYQKAASERLRALLSPGDVFIDVGAGVGWFSLLAADRVGQDGLVYAFEPNSPTFDALKATIAARKLGRIVTCLQAGLADCNEYAEVVLPTIPDGRGARLMRRPLGVLNRVPVNMLDNYRFSKPIAAIKINTNDDDVAVLRGAIATMRTHRPHLILPRRALAQLSKLLPDLGYAISERGHDDELVVLSPQGEKRAPSPERGSPPKPVRRWRLFGR